MSNKGFVPIPLVIFVLAVILVLGAYFVIDQKRESIPTISSVSKMEQFLWASITSSTPIAVQLSLDKSRILISLPEKIIGEISLDDFPSFMYVNKIIDAKLVPSGSVSAIGGREILFRVLDENTQTFWMAGFNGNNIRKILFVDGNNTPVFSSDDTKFFVLSSRFPSRAGSSSCDVSSIGYIDIVAYDFILGNQLHLPMPLGSKDPAYWDPRITSAKWIDKASVEVVDTPLSFPYFDTRTLGFIPDCPTEEPSRKYTGPFISYLKPTNFPPIERISGWKTYGVKGFELQFPLSWTEINDHLENNEVGRLLSPKQAYDKYEYALAQIYISENKKLKDVVGEFPDGLYSSVTHSPVTIGGLAGYKITYIANLPGNAYSERYFVQKDNKIYLVDFALLSSKSPIKSNFLNIFNKAISTFKFINE